MPDQNLLRTKNKEEQFTNKQENQTDVRDESKAYPEKELDKKKETQEMEDSIELKALRGKLESYREKMEILESFDDSPLKSKIIKAQENLKNLSVEPVYSEAENKKTEVPVFFASGWGGTPEVAYKECIKELNNMGRDVLSVELIREIKISDIVNEKYSLTETQKALAILKVLEEKGIEKTDLFVHSEAGINGLKAAFIAPIKFRKIIMAMPAGIIGKDSFWGLVGRYSKGMLAEITKMIKNPKRIKPTIKGLIDLFKYTGENPWLALKEVVAISSSDIRYMLKDLREKGVKIDIIAAQDDPIFPPERIEKSNPNLHGHIKVVTGTHIDIIADSKRMMKVVDELLEKK